MPKPSVIISVVGIVAILVLGGVLVSVLGDDGPAAAPKGYATFSGEFDGRTVSFAYPRAWGPVERRVEKGISVVRVFGPRDADGARSVVRMTAQPDTTISFKSHYGLIDGQDRLQLRDNREISEEDVDVPGAEVAKRRVLEYDYTTPAGEVQRSRTSAIFALADGGLFVNLIVDTSAAKPDVDAPAVLDTLTLDG